MASKGLWDNDSLDIYQQMLGRMDMKLPEDWSFNLNVDKDSIKKIEEQLELAKKNIEKSFSRIKLFNFDGKIIPDREVERLESEMKIAEKHIRNLQSNASYNRSFAEEEKNPDKKKKFLEEAEAAERLATAMKSVAEANREAFHKVADMAHKKRVKQERQEAKALKKEERKNKSANVAEERKEDTKHIDSGKKAETIEKKDEIKEPEIKPEAEVKKEEKNTEDKAEAQQEGYSEVADSAEKASEAILDVGHATEGIDASPIENINERLEHVAETANKAKESIAESAEKNVESSIPEIPESTRKIGWTDDEKWVSPDVKAERDLAHQVDFSVAPQNAEEAEKQIKALNVLYSELRETQTQLNMQLRTVNPEDVEKAEQLKSKLADVGKQMADNAQKSKELKGMFKEPTVTDEADYVGRHEKEPKKEEEKVAKEAPSEKSDFPQTLDEANQKLTELDKTYSKLRSELFASQSKLRIIPSDDEEALERMRSQIESIKGQMADVWKEERAIVKEFPDAKSLNAVEKGEEKEKKGETVYQSLPELEDAIRQTQGEIDSLREKAKSGELIDVDDTIKKIGVLEKSLKTLKDARKALVGEEEKPQPAPQPEPETHGIGYYKQRQKELPKEIQRAKMGIKKSDDVEGAIANVRNLEAELQNVNNILAQAQAGSWAGQVKASFATLGKEIASVIQLSVRGIAILAKSVGSVLKGAFNIAKGAVVGFANTIKSSITGAVTAVKTFTALMKNVVTTTATLAKNFASGGFKVMASGFHLAGTTLGSLGKGAITVASSLGNLSKQGLSLVASSAQKAGSALVSLGRMGINAIGNYAKQAITGVKGLIGKFNLLGGKTSGKLLKSLTSIKSMLMRRVKRTFISSIFNQAKEGLQEFAKYSSSFNASMSAIKNSAKGVAGNMSVTLGNLVNIIAPPLTAILNIVSRVIQAVNAMFAALTGKGTVSVAKKSTDDYAKSLKGAGGAAKDLNKQLYGFDEITRQEDNSGGGGGGSTIGYEEKKIGDILDERMQAIVDALKDKEFFKAGQLIGEMFNDWVSKARTALQSFRPIAKKWAANIADLLNGIMDTFNAFEFGAMFGDLVNLIADTLNTFLTKFHWDVFGKKISDAIMGLFDTVEWELVGETVANGFNAIYRTVANIVTNLKWEDIGLKLSKAVTSFFLNLDLDSYTTSIIGGVNGVVSATMKFIKNVPWVQIAETIFANISKAINGIKWEEIAKLFINAIDNIRDIIDEFFNSDILNNISDIASNLINTMSASIIKRFKRARTDATRWASLLTKALNTMIKKIDFGAIGEALGEGIETAFTVRGEFLNTFNFGELGKKVAEGLNRAIGAIDWKKVGKTFADGMNKIWELVGNFISEFKWDKFGQGIADGITSLFSNIDWDKRAQMLANGINGIINGITVAISNTPWGQIAQDFFKHLNTVIDSIDWTKLTELMKKSASAITDVFGELVNSHVIVNLGSKLGGVLEETLNNGIDWAKLGELARTGLTDVVLAFTGIVNRIDFDTLAQNIKSGIEKFFDKENGGAGFDNAIEELTGKNKGINRIINGFSSLVEGENAIDFDGIATIIGQKAGTLLGQINWQLLATSVTMGALQLFGAFWKITSLIPFDTIASELAKGVNKFFTTPGPDGKLPFVSVAEKVGDGISNIAKAFSTLINGDEKGEGGIDFDGIGKAIGEGANTLLSKIDFGQLAKDVLFGWTKVVQQFVLFPSRLNLPDITRKIANGINEFFSPDNSGKSPLAQAAGSATEGLNAIIDAFSAFTTNLNLSTIRNSIVDSINSFINGAKLDQIITDVGEFIREVGLQFLNMFNPAEGGIDLGSLASKLATGINNIFKDSNGDIDKAKALEIGQSIGNAIKNIFENIDQFIEETDWKAIGTAIGTALGKVDWPGIAKSVIKLLWNALLAAVELTGGLLGSFIRRIFGVPSADTFDATGKEWASQFAESLENAYGEELTGTRQQKLAKIAALYASGLNESFLQGFQMYEEESSNAFASMADSAMSSIMVAFEQADKDRAINAIIDLFKLTGDTAKEEAEKLLASGMFGNFDEQNFDGWKLLNVIESANSKEEIIQLFKDYGIEISEGLELAVEAMFAGRENITKEAIQLLATLQDLGDKATFEDTKKAFQDAGMSVCDEFIKAIGGTGTENITAALQLLGMGVSDEAIASLDAANLAENLDKYMDETGHTIQQVVATLMSESGVEISEIAAALGTDVGTAMGLVIPEGVAEGLGKGKKDVETAVQDIANAGKPTTEQQTELNTAGQNAGGKITGGVEEGTQKGQEGVEKANQAVTDAVQKKYEKLPDNVKPYASAMLEYITAAITEGSEPVQTTVQGLVDDIITRVKETLSGSAGAKIASDFISGIKFGFSINSVGVVSAVSEISNLILFAFNVNLSVLNGYTIGSNIMIGLYNGIVEHAQDVIDKVAEVCGGAIKAGEEKLGIESPSKVFRQIGSYTMQGMEIGLAESGEKAIDTVGNIAQSIINEAENGDGVSMKVTAMTDGLDVVSGKMSRLAEIFSDIADTIVEMGGLEIPTIASGKVFPDSARLEAKESAPTTSNNLSRDNMEDALYSAITRAMSNISTDQNVNVYLDGRELTDAVTKYQRQQSRAWGV